MHVTVDPEVCVGSGQCALAAPEVFDQDERVGTVVLIDDQPPAALHEVVREAVSRCPTRAITATER